MDDSNLPVLRRFVVFEGLDGAGTTTQLRLLEGALDRASLPYWITAEPSPHPAGRLARQILKGEVDARPETLARIFSADRHEHLYGPDGILERLGRGELVVCDRYVFSSLAYQGVACGPELPRKLNETFPLPELVIFFDLPADTAMSRVEKRGEREIFETRPLQEKIREAYEATLALYAGSGMRLLRLDASRSVEAVSADILAAIGAVAGVDLMQSKHP